MNNVFVILWMIFFHIVDDFCLQVGWLSAGKQKSYWKENAPEKMYKYDYIWALIMHSFSWTFMIMLPIAYILEFNVGFDFVLMFIANVAIHAFTDDAKANRKTINLWQDQIVHIIQIMFTVKFLLWW